MGEGDAPPSSGNLISVEEGTVELPPRKQASAFDAPMQAPMRAPVHARTQPIRSPLPFAMTAPMPIAPRAPEPSREPTSGPETSDGHALPILKGIALGLVVVVAILGALLALR